MLVQINTDNHIDGNQGFRSTFENMITDELGRFSEQLTSIQVHIGDENGQKEGGNDKRCMLEARLKGMGPVAVTSHADTHYKAVEGAIDKLKSSLDSAIGKLRNH